MAEFLKHKILLLCFLLLPASLLIDEVRQYALSSQCTFYKEMEITSITYPMCKLAAQQGDVDAQFNLGTIYYFGMGVSRNYKESIKWYRSAAEQGDAGGQTMVGVLYAMGRGVPKNEQEAYVWYLLAAGQGAEKAIELSSKAEQKLTPEQISAAKAESAHRAAAYQ